MIDMTYCGYEVKKIISSRFYICLLAILLIANIILGAITVNMDKQQSCVSPDQFDKCLDNTIYNAKMNYINIDDKEGEIAKYQIEIIEKYSTIKSSVIPEATSGFAFLLSSFIPFASSGIMAIMTAIMLTYHEYSSNLIISSFHLKRKRLCISKIIVLFSCVVLHTLTFCAASILGIAIGGVSFTGGGSYIQSILRYMYCPYRITVVEATALRCLMAIFFIFVFALVVFTIGIIIQNTVFTFLSSLLLVVFNVILTKMFETNIFSLFYNININQFVNDGWLLKFSGKKMYIFLSQVELMSVLGLSLIILSISIAVHLFRYSPTVSTVRHKRRYSNKLFGFKSRLINYEIKKILSSKAIIGVVLLLLCYSVISITQPTPTNSDYERIYKYHIEKMSELTYSEQIDYSMRTKGELSRIIKESVAIREKYKKGEVSKEEYDNVQQRAGAAELEQSVIKVIDDQLDSIAKINEIGISAKLLYPSGWKCLINSDINSILVFALIWVLSLFYCSNYENGFENILTSSFVGKGKERMIIGLKQVSVTIICSVGLTMLFAIIEILPIHLVYRLSDFSEYVTGAGVELINSKLTFIEIFLIRAIYSLIGILLLVLLIQLLSKFLKKTMLVITTTSLIEITLMCISMISGKQVYSIKSYFTFDFLSVPFMNFVIHTLLILTILVVIKLIINKQGKVFMLEN